MDKRGNDLKDIYKKIETARETWHSTTKPLIWDELDRITSSQNLDWFVDINDSIKNHETITLAFKNGPSGLTYNDEDVFNQQEGRSGNLIKYGGTLNFSFVYLGDVMVWMTYPYIIDILENTEYYHDLNRYKQDSINKQIISDAVNLFLDEIIAWHLGKIGQEHRIGFRTSKLDEES